MAHDARPSSGSARLEAAAHAIVSCNRCPRLRSYCERVAREKRAAYRQETYWGRPVPGFGDPDARIVLVGLAPAAHGANRTGRIFTGDGRGGSGDFLMAALHAAGLANQPFSHAIDDGLRVHDVWMAASVRCAPPENKPSPQEIAECYPHLTAELDALPRAQVLVALGALAFDTCWKVLGDRGRPRQKKPSFEHGGVFTQPGGLSVVMSYHPSRQNTHTGRLTPAMLRETCATARSLVR